MTSRAPIPRIGLEKRWCNGRHEGIVAWKTWWRSIVEHVSHSHGAIFHILRILCAHPSPFCQIGGYNLHTQWSSSRYDALGALAVSRKQQAVYGCSSLVSLPPFLVPTLPPPLSLLALFHARLSTRLLLLLLLARYVSSVSVSPISLSLSLSLCLSLSLPSLPAKG